jgi:glycosyltransferase involved in cell wall biosynthesis
LNAGTERTRPRLHRAQPLRDTDPLVSICIPTYNRRARLEAALDSALTQSYEPLEVVVVDDASTDGTARAIGAIDDPRLRLGVNPTRLGQNANRNRSVALARGELLKFLDDDDLLDPDCVARLVEPFVADERIGLAFCRRRVVIDGVSGEAGRSWLERHGEPHLGFSHLEAINDGRDLFEQSLSAGLHFNWIGEPCCVMVRRSHLRPSGAFGFHERQTLDWGLWLRVMSRSRVAFVDDELATYRRGADTESARNASSHRFWTDRLWLLEGLAADADIRTCFPYVCTLLQDERRQAWRTAARLGHVRDSHSVPANTYLPYLWFRARAAAGRRPATFGPVSPMVNEPRT